MQSFIGFAQRTNFVLRNGHYQEQGELITSHKFYGCNCMSCPWYLILPLQALNMPSHCLAYAGSATDFANRFMRFNNVYWNIVIYWAINFDSNYTDRLQFYNWVVVTCTKLLPDGMGRGDSIWDESWDIEGARSAVRMLVSFWIFQSPAKCQMEKSSHQSWAFATLQDLTTRHLMPHGFVWSDVCKIGMVCIQFKF